MNTNPNPVLFERLTPDNAVLLLIDIQSGLLLGVTTSPSISLKSNLLGLARLGQLFKLPTILTTSTAQGPNGPFMPEIRAMYPQLAVQNRTVVNAWDDPTFVKTIQQTGRRKLIMAGITTDVCLLFPALSAVQAGYDVYAVIDASGSFNAQAETAAIARLSQAGVKVANWSSVAAELQHDWALPVSEQVGQMLAEQLTAMNYLADNLKAQQPAVSA